ncbi:TIGR03088 family PEP-CTERM/XrtA system glycosyltransferase [Thiohalorhabdus denitrificans]|uniref:TIGR03088 family PEP-CTERM/XrtA system glycosyltransferase n=1 Tax=Thiohalorhabdus denitrificans TaxID=381306 RepID=UPI0006D579D0|nr:TIGR03088 family PEP-CTERM/XrtA system glycosyltransferase [Thiohalorhabdus denitrificans]
MAHVIHSLRVGGMENGLVNLINRTPAGALRHVVICLEGYSDFATRLDPAVEVYALHKHPGLDAGLYGRLWRLLRTLRPDLVHTRNLAAIEAQLPAALAGVRRRVHGEHGWDMADLGGASRRYRMLRRALRPLVHHFIPLSLDLEDYLGGAIGVPPERMTRICNGVDVGRFRPVGDGGALRGRAGFPPAAPVIGWVGRMEGEKDPLALVRAFIRVAGDEEEGETKARLVMLGDGSLRGQAREELEAAGLAHRAWLPGERADVAEILPDLDLFVLPSLAEGISNTVLEAMACGVPVVATRVGGNPELIVDGETGVLVPPGDPRALGEALAEALADPDRRAAMGRASRARAEERYSIEAMVAAYLGVYRRLLGQGAGPLAGGPIPEGGAR